MPSHFYLFERTLKTIALLCLVLCVCWSTDACQLQETQGKTDTNAATQKPEKIVRIKERSETADDNDSGKATALQNQNSVSIADLLDDNSDGVLDPFEALDVLVQLEKETGKPLTGEELKRLLAEGQREEMREIESELAEQDKNKDGKTTLDELDEFWQEMLGDNIDRNNDKIVTADEVLAADIEGFDFLSEEEMKTEIDKVFREQDKNSDGELTSNEASEDLRWDEMLGADFDRNDRVTRAEFEEMFRADQTPAAFDIESETAHMSGVICADTPAKVLRLVFEHPQVKTIEMKFVPGSIDDEANLRAAEYVRRFGLNTRLRRFSTIASGGTDFFLAGNKRSVEKGARVGIHSWGGSDLDGRDVPRNDPQHNLYLDYYRKMGTPASFYWRTLEAAPADKMHWMTEDELKKFKFRTEDGGSQASGQ